MAEDTAVSNEIKVKRFAKAICKVIDEKYRPAYVLKVKIDHSNMSKDLKQKCAAHQYNVLGWVLTAFEKAMVGKKNWKTEHVPFLWVKVAEKEGKYQHGYVILSCGNSAADKIQSAIDKVREQLLATIEINMMKIGSVTDLQLEPNLIAYVDKDGNAKLRNVIASKTILGI